MKKAFFIEKPKQHHKSYFCYFQLKFLLYDDNGNKFLMDFESVNVFQTKSENCLILFTILGNLLRRLSLKRLKPTVSKCLHERVTLGRILRLSAAIIKLNFPS